MRWCFALAARHAHFSRIRVGPKRHFVSWDQIRSCNSGLASEQNHTKPSDEPITGADPGILSSSSEERTAVSASLGARDGEGKIVFSSYDDFGGHGPLSSAGGGMPWMMATEGMVDDERTGQGSAQCVRWLPGCGNLLSPGGWQGLRRASSLRGMPVTNNDGNLLPRLRTPVPQAIDRQYLRLSRN